MLGRWYFQQGSFAIIIGPVVIAASYNIYRKAAWFWQRGIAFTDSSLGGVHVNDSFFEALKLTHA